MGKKPQNRRISIEEFRREKQGGKKVREEVVKFHPPLFLPGLFTCSKTSSFFNRYSSVLRFSSPD
jgi:hypothetical protein